MPKRETFKERSHFNMTSLMTEVLCGPKIFPRYKLGSINYFYTKNKNVIFNA